MQRIALFVVLVAVLALPARADAQMGRWLGAALSGAGAAMLLLDPQQPTQPSVVSRDALIDEAVGFVAGRCGTLPFSCDFRDLVVALEPDLRVFEGRGVLVGAAAGVSVGIVNATSNGRTVYAGTFVPYEERSAGLKYGGAALVIGGALMAALWPNQPAMQNVSVTPSQGGVRAAKTITW